MIVQPDFPMCACLCQYLMLIYLACSPYLYNILNRHIFLSYLSVLCAVSKYTCLTHWWYQKHASNILIKHPKLSTWIWKPWKCYYNTHLAFLILEWSFPDLITLIFNVSLSLWIQLGSFLNTTLQLQCKDFLIWII